MRNKAIDVEAESKKENLMKGFVISFDEENIFVASYDEYFFERTKYEACGFEVFVKEDKLVNILNRLPEKKRNVLILTHLVGLTDEEIVESLNITKKTLSEYRSRLLGKCKELAEKHG